MSETRQQEQDPRKAHQVIDERARRHWERTVRTSNTQQAQISSEKKESR